MWESHVRSQYGRDTIKAIKRGARSKVFQARCKRLSVLHAWIEGRPMKQIESDFTTDGRAPLMAGNVRSFADLARHHLAGAFNIALAVSRAYEAAKPEFRDLQTRLETGLPSEALRLLGLRARLDRGAYLALFREGLVDKSRVLDLEPNRLREIVGDVAAKKILGPRHGLYEL